MVEPLTIELEAPPARRPPERRLVVRTALLARLCASPPVAVVAIVAPAGYGKTTLLAQWAERDERPVSRLDPDADFDELDVAGRLLLVDDVHETTSPEPLQRLLARVPPGATVALAGRSEPPRLLPRLRAEGRLLELGAADLALRDREAQSLLRAAGVLLPERDRLELERLTEGWPAVLFLAALAVRGGIPVSAFAGDDRFVADYLQSEHLAGLTPAQRRFATHTSVLRELTAEACDDLLGRSDSARVLEALDRRGIAVPLDHCRRRYRLRRLVRDVLHAELQHEDPRRARSLHRAAASWCDAHGEAHEALRHAAAAGDRARIAALAARIAVPACLAGRFAEVEELLELVGGEPSVEQQPDLCLAASWTHALRARPGESRRWADHAARALSGDDPRLRLLQALLCRDGADQMLDDATAACAALAVDSAWRPAALAVRGVARLLAGDADRGERDLDDAADAASDAGAVAVRDLALCLRALGGHGDVPQAGEPSTLALLLEAAAAHACLRDGDRARAAAGAARADELVPWLTHAVPWLSTYAGCELVHVRLGLVDADGARELLRRVGDVFRVRPRLGTLVQRAAELDRRTRALAEPDGRWAATLTPAEQRLLPLLATHLAFREIGERLFVSRNTVKTQAISIYRKFGVSSRSDAIARATDLGLIDEDAVHHVQPATPGGLPWRI